MYTISSRKVGLRVLLFAAIMSFTTSIASNFSASANEPTEWTITVETEQLQRQFAYKGSNLSPVAKVVVKYSKNSEHDPKAFETLWYHNGNPIGMERSGKYGVNRGDLTYIQVLQKGRTEEENKAAAFTLMRLGLTTYLNLNPVATITVPAASLDAICDEMRHRKCEDLTNRADEAVHGILFNMESEPSGAEKKLVFKTEKK